MYNLFLLNSHVIPLLGFLMLLTRIKSQDVQVSGFRLFLHGEQIISRYEYPLSTDETLHGVAIINFISWHTFGNCTPLLGPPKNFVNTSSCFGFWFLMWASSGTWIQGLQNTGQASRNSCSSSILSHDITGW